MNKGKRSFNAQSKHDRMVKKIAEDLKIQGYKVEADIKGFKKPSKIDGFIPDVIAKKGIKRKIVEVETKKSNSTDKDQQSAFRSFARKRVNTAFSKKIV